MQAVYVISRISGTLLFAKEFLSIKDDDTPDPVVTPARAFTFSPLRNNNSLASNLLAPQLYWSLYLNMMPQDVHEDTYYVSNDSLVIFADCPHDILTVGVFELPMAHLSLVVRDMHEEGHEDNISIDALLQNSIYNADPSEIFDDSIIEDEARRKTAVDNFLLTEHADDCVFHATVLVHKLGTAFTTAFDKTLNKCNTNMRTRFARFETVVSGIIADWFGGYILRSMALMLRLPLNDSEIKNQQDGYPIPQEMSIQLIVLKRTPISLPPALPQSSTSPLTYSLTVAQSGRTPKPAKTPKGEVQSGTQYESDIVYYYTPVLTRPNQYRYSIQKTPKRSKAERKSRSVPIPETLCTEESYHYKTLAVYSVFGFYDDPLFLNGPFYTCISDLLTTMMATEYVLGNSVEDGNANLCIKFSGSRYHLMTFWQDASQAVFVLLLKDPPQERISFPFWLPFLLPPLLL